MPTPETNKTRLLLTLWEMEGTKVAVKRGKLIERVKRKKEKTADYQEIFAQLAEVGAIALSSEKRTAKVTLTDKGVQMLGAGLKNSEFQFSGTVVASRFANTLLNWIRQSDTMVSASATATATATTVTEIESYEEFEKLALSIYHRLNQDYNYDDLVPIYRLRREIGEQVTRSQFNEWLLEMQAQDIIQLMGGEMPDITPDKREDSIETPVAGLRYYLQLLSA